MVNTGDPAHEREGPDRLSRLSQASLRINESLDLDTVLQQVVDSARLLTGSRYGVWLVITMVTSLVLATTGWRLWWQRPRQL